ncbi:hypothetical protein [Streptomyces sp. NPDC090025]|uniref:hypothetical protein n=1 Tax=Streptomyces sp. NPDC090025 TaxID=3365922 RepID=UPI0038376FAA
MTTFSGLPRSVESATREEIEAAAARRIPAHQTVTLEGEWYVLVGGALYYARELIEDVTGVRDVVRARKHLFHTLGFPVFALADARMIDDGHPRHTRPA